jgi:hypothetical protein
MKGMAHTRISAIPCESPPETDALLTIILEAAETLTRAEGSSFATDLAEPDPLFSELLRLLTYCYANGVYASAEIELALSHDPALRRLANGRRLESSALRSFRRRHRLALQRCLARALEADWAHERGATGGGGCIPCGHAASSKECRGGRLWMPDFEREAADRLRRAICSDTASLDD